MPVRQNTYCARDPNELAICVDVLVWQARHATLHVKANSTIECHVCPQVQQCLRGQVSDQYTIRLPQPPPEDDPADGWMLAETPCNVQCIGDDGYPIFACKRGDHSLGEHASCDDNCTSIADECRS